MNLAIRSASRSTIDRIIGGLLLTALLCTAGCAPETAAGTRVPPPPKVVVVKVQERDVPIEAEGIGTTAAIESVMIRARVSGFLTEGPPQHFSEGANVKKGQTLLVIDRAPFEASLRAAQAKLDEAQASLDAANASKQVDIAKAQVMLSEARLYVAQLDEARGRRLVERGAETREEYDKQAAALKQTQAEVDARKADLLQAQVDFKAGIALAQANLEKAQADLTSARLDLDYCEMKSPIDGRIGELKVKLGNYVSGGVNGAELVSIQQLNPMGIDIQASSRFLPEITRLIEGGLTTRLIVQGDRLYPETAEAYFLDNRIDPTTSTVLVKARVPNNAEELLPGDYVQTRSVIGEYAGALVVPEQAVVETQAGPVCYVVDDQGLVTLQPVQSVDTYRGLRVVEGGLAAGQKVIVEGLQMVRPGQKVDPSEVELATFERTAQQMARPTSSGTRSNLLERPNVRIGGSRPASPAPPVEEPAKQESAPPAAAPSSIEEPSP